MSSSNRCALSRTNLKARESGASGGYRPDGTAYGGQRLSRGALYLMLQNRIYRGEITHKGNAYPGEHPAIVDQAALGCRFRRPLPRIASIGRPGAYAKQPSLLAGWSLTRPASG